jgi:uncharacterized protein (DUF433 family)
MDEWIAKRDPETMSGELCFTGTRVPVRILFEYIKAGESLQDFMEGYPSVSVEQMRAVIELSEKQLEAVAS